MRRLSGDFEMKHDFFVMLNLQNGGITPMVEDDDSNLATYETYEEAVQVASRNILGNTFGFEVFERGRGEFGE